MRKERYSAPPYLLTTNFTKPWYIHICPSGPKSLSVHVTCSLSVVAYLGRRENISILNVSMGSCVKMLGESMGMLQMDNVSLIRSLSSFLILGTEKGVCLDG